MGHKNRVISFTDNPSTTTQAPSLQNGTTGWELALVTAPSSNESATAAGKLVLLNLSFVSYGMFPTPPSLSSLQKKFFRE